MEEMVPAARRMAVLADAHTVSSSNMRSLQEAASARGVELVIRTVERPERIGPEIEEAKRDGVEALNVLSSPLLYTRRLDIFERAEALRIPTIYQSPEFAEEGGLIGYGPYLTQMFRQLARQLAKVLRGEKVSDLPVEQPTTFGLAVNLKTAKAIGFFNDDVLSLDVAAFAQPGPESLVRHRSAPRGGEQHANSVHSPCVLRRCRLWPGCRRAAEKRDELAPFHSITSSTRASTLAGISRPSAFAVLRLTTSSYLLAACTGRSAGFSPLRMRST